MTRRELKELLDEMCGSEAFLRDEIAAALRARSEEDARRPAPATTRDEYQGWMP